MHRLALVTAHDLLLDDEFYRAGGSATVDQRLQDEQDDRDRRLERECLCLACSSFGWCVRD